MNMTEQEKSDELIALIDELCKADFFKQESILDQWVNKLKKIYTNGYRHTYSDIFYKVQTIISENTDSEVLEILGENLNTLGKRLFELLSQNKDDANLQNVTLGYKKFSDHIKLEIGRYNFIKSQFMYGNFINNTNTNANVKSADDGQAELIKMKQQVDKISDDFKSVRSVTTEAKKQLDGIDDKLENNKISSITTLTIFSAVVLAFSGGITFEAGIFKGMAESSPYRLVFIIALTGFILFNTIFVLLYLVGKLAGKTISTKCKYMSTDMDVVDIGQQCGEGYCQKECNSTTLFCRIYHKYSYIFVINAVLLCTMYDDFILWFFRQQAYTFMVFAWQIIPLIAAIVSVLVYKSMQKVQEKRIVLKFKIQLINDIISPSENNSVLHQLSSVMSSFLGAKTTNLSDKFLKSIEGTKVVTDKQYKNILHKLHDFTCQEIVKCNRLCESISRRQHLQNKKIWKVLKTEFREYLATVK